MSRLEDELKNALRREEPRVGFAERVLARVEAAPQPVRWFRWSAMRWAAAGALGLVLAGGLEYRRERLQGERAKQELMLALRITGSKLQFAQERVMEMSAER